MLSAEDRRPKAKGATRRCSRVSGSLGSARTREDDGEAGSRFFLPARHAKQARQPPHVAKVTREALSRFFRGEGACKKNRLPAPRATLQRFTFSTPPSSGTLRPTVARIRRCDRDLGEQVRRALSSVALNVAEGNHSQGGNRVARFSTAAGSNAEARAALRVAVAWGYVVVSEIEAGEALLDRVAAMLYRLGARR